MSSLFISVAALLMLDLHRFFFFNGLFLPTKPQREEFVPILCRAEC